MLTTTRRVVIAGGGFGGVSAVLDLAKKDSKNLEIFLISDKPYLEYYPSLYRVVMGEPYHMARIPLKEIFAKKRVNLIQDVINDVNLNEKTVQGASGSTYTFDFLILALGAEITYYDVPGLKQLSFALKSIPDALRLNIHLQELFRTSQKATTEEKVHFLHIVIIGGGETGCELAGALAVYSKELAKKSNIDTSFITIDLMDSGPRLLKRLPQDISERVERRLRQLGVNIFLNRRVVREEIEEVYLKDMRMKTLTVVWAAGIRVNHVLSKIEGLSLDKKGRVLVDEFLQTKGFEDIFVIGDAASTTYSGMAQTAIADASYVAEIVSRKIKSKKLMTYKPKKPSHAVPIGNNWAAVSVATLSFYGNIGWLLRRGADLRFFLSILPLRKAVTFFFNKKRL